MEWLQTTRFLLMKENVCAIAYTPLKVNDEFFWSSMEGIAI
jgi:hypothetical protein